MVRAIMHGCNGKMGQVITGLIKEDPEIEIVAGIDIMNCLDNGYPVFTNIFDCNISADVVIDFASAKAVDALITFCMLKQLPVVLCTTGMSDEQMHKVWECAREIPILKSANMSLGVNMLLKLLKDASKILAPAGFDIEIIEKHHRMKVDAPSGTALAMADSINEALDHTYTYKLDRSMERKTRGDKEIGIQALRGGTIVGEHDVVFAGIDEVIQFSHTAYSKTVFAKGAVQAAKFLVGKSEGFYDMSDVVEL